jgi:hypothetical protein
MSYLHLSRRLIVVAITVFAVGAGAASALAAASPHLTPKGPTSAQLKKLDSTPLGAAIEQQSKLIQLNIETGTPALDRAAVTKLTANRTACDKAASAVSPVTARTGGRQPEIKREWLKGVRLLAFSDQQFAAYYRSYAKGEESESKLNTAIANSNYGDGLTGWAFNGLTGNPGPLPKRHPVH